MPDDFRITVLVGDMGQDGVAAVLRPDPPPVQAESEALDERLARRRVHGDQWGDAAAPEPGGVVPIHDGRSGVDQTHGVGFQGDLQFLPVKKIVADGVAPGHQPELPAVRVVLEEQVVFALEEDQPVRVIQPVLPRSEMELRPVSLIIDSSGLDGFAHRLRVALSDLIHADMTLSSCFSVHGLDARGPTLKVGHIPTGPGQPLGPAGDVVARHWP